MALGFRPFRCCCGLTLLVHESGCSLKSDFSAGLRLSQSRSLQNKIFQSRESYDVFLAMACKSRCLESSLVDSLTRKMRCAGKLCRLNYLVD